MDALYSALEARTALWEKIKSHLDTVEGEGRADSGEAEATYTRMNDDLRAIDARVKDLSDLARRNADADEMRARYAGAKAPAADNGKPTDGDVLRRMVSGEVRSFEFAPAAEARDLVKGTNSAGGYTVPTSFYGRLVENMIVNSGLLQTNVTVLNTAGGETIQIPRATAHPAAAWIAEAGTITESDATFAQASLSAYKAGFSTQIATELEQDSAVDLLGYLARRGGEALGNGAGAAYVTGDGSGKPTGIVGAASAGVTGGTGVTGAFTADNLIDLFYSVISPYRTNGYWLMNDSTLAVARKLKDGNGRYLFDMDAPLSSDNGGVGSILGRPVVTDPNVAAVALSAKSVLFGDMSAYYIRNVQGIRVERSVDFAFQNDLVTWRFLLRTDGKLIDTSGAVKYFAGGAS